MNTTPATVTALHSLSKVGALLTPKADGFIGNFTKGDLWLGIEPISNDIDVIRVNQEKKITLPNPINDGLSHRRLFQIGIPLLTSKDAGPLVTKFPSNHVKLVRFSRETNYFQVWEVAVAAQSRPKDPSKILFFLTEQQCYSSLVYRDSNGRIVMPDYQGFSQWQAIQDYFTTILGNHDLPRLPKTSAKSSTYRQSPPLKNEEGEVLWYSLAQGLGPILTNQGVARVHWSQIVSANRFRFLRPTQKVTFERLVPTKNTQQKHRQSKFQWDAEGVRAID